MSPKAVFLTASKNQAGKKGGRLTEFNFRREIPSIMQSCQAAKLEFGKPDPNVFTKTVQRALAEVEHLISVNQNGSFVTLQQLEQFLGTRVHNHVSRLIREEKLTRFSLGRYAASGSLVE